MRESPQKHGMPTLPEEHPSKESSKTRTDSHTLSDAGASSKVRFESEKSIGSSQLYESEVTPGDDRNGDGKEGWVQTEAQVLEHLTQELLESVRQDFEAGGGTLGLQQFAKSMIVGLEPEAYDNGIGHSVGRGGIRNFRASRRGSFVSEPVKLSAKESARLAGQIAGIVDLFEQVDVHKEGAISWEQVSSHLIETGMSADEAYSLDNIKSYEPSTVPDKSKHESPVDKLIYLDKLDSLACISTNLRSFSLYDPQRCTVQSTFSGHRGSVVDCCYVESLGQIASSAADMTVSFWDPTTEHFRGKVSAKEVQTSLEYEPQSRCLFSGGIDGTLCRWSLGSLEHSLADTRKGHHKQAINDLIAINDIDMLASASSDGSILMWDLELMKPMRTFRAHKKGAHKLAYSDDYRLLLSSGLDQEACVWNPYVDKTPIFRLKAHTNSLCGLCVVPNTPQIITGDVLGMFRLWDMRNFRCVQTWAGSDSQISNRLNSFCMMPPHRRLAAGGLKIKLFDYIDDWNGADVTDTQDITDSLYNPHRGEFYTASRTSLKVWNASTGSLFKVLRGVAGREITAMCLSDTGRKIYIGDSLGRITSHNMNSGMPLCEFEAHFADISCLAVWPGTEKIFSASWDGVVRIHSDEKHRPPQLKAEFQRHRDGVTCIACSTELNLLATGGTDAQVCLIDLKTLKFEYSFSRMQHVISAIDFLGTRCLLAIADQGGYISLWRVRPHHEKWTRVFYFKNAALEPSPDGELELPAPAAVAGTPIPLTAMKFAPMSQDPTQPRPLMYTADAKGYLRCWDLSVLCKRRKVVDVKLSELFKAYQQEQLRLAAGGGPSPTENFGQTPASTFAEGAIGKRSFFFTEPKEEEISPSQASSNPQLDRRGTRRFGNPLAAFGIQEEKDLTPLPNEVQVKFEVRAHDEAVSSLHLLNDPEGVLTVGSDRRVQTWSRNLQKWGALLVLGEGDSFTFPLDVVLRKRDKMQVAEELLAKIGSWGSSLAFRLPALARGSTGIQQALAAAAAEASGYPPGEGHSPAGAENGFPPLLSRANTSKGSSASGARKSLALSASQPMLRSKSASKSTLALEPLPSMFGDEGWGAGLLRQVEKSTAAKNLHKRQAAMSRDEAEAAERLAMAMSNLGLDNFGSYMTLAESIRPKSKASSKDSKGRSKRKRGEDASSGGAGLGHSQSTPGF